MPDVELPDVAGKNLRELIRELGALAAKESGAASPELRVTAPHGQFVVPIAQGCLRINRWTLKVGGADLSPDQIFALITGAEAGADAVGLDLGGGRRRRARGTTIAIWAAVILGTNGVKAWMLTRPPPPAPLLADHAPLARESAQRFIAEIAGDDQTGTDGGARILKIAKDGRVHWLLLGPAGETAEDPEVAVQPVQARGQPRSWPTTAR